MAMASADGSSQSFGGLTAQIGWFGLRVGGHPALSLHSSNEPGELSQWLCHDDSTIHIAVVIIIINRAICQTFYRSTDNDGRSSTILWHTIIQIRTCIVANVIVVINPTDLLSVKDAWVPRLAIDGIVQNVIQRRKLDVTVSTAYLETSK